MTSPLPPVVCLAILQADHVGKITSEERKQGVGHSLMEHVKSLTSFLDDSLTFFPLWHPSWLSRILRVGFEEMSLPSPQVVGLWIKANFPLCQQLPLKYWLFILICVPGFCYWFLSVWYLWWNQGIPFHSVCSLLCFHFLLWYLKRLLFIKKRITG